MVYEQLTCSLWRFLLPLLLIAFVLYVHDLTVHPMATIHLLYILIVDIYLFNGYCLQSTTGGCSFAVHFYCEYLLNGYCVCLFTESLYQTSGVHIDYGFLSLG